MRSPFRIYADYRTRTLEREAAMSAATAESTRQDREGFLKAMQAMTDVTLEAIRASREQSGVLQRFLDGFSVIDPPKVREWDDEADLERYVQRQAAKGKVIPGVPELAGLGEFESFKAILDRIDS